MQKTPSSLKKSSSVLNTSITSSPTRPALVKKLKQAEFPRCLIPSNRSVEGSLAASGSPSLATSSQDTAATHTIKTANLSSKLNTDAARVNMDAKTSNTASGELPQVPKEPPVLPDKLPPQLLVKVANLEQVCYCSCRCSHHMHATESSILVLCFQLILKDIGTSGKLSIKARISYDEHLVEYVCTYGQNS